MESHGTQVSNPPSQQRVRSGTSQRYVKEANAVEVVDEDVRYLSSIRNQLFQVSNDNGKTPYFKSSLKSLQLQPWQPLSRVKDFLNMGQLQAYLLTHYVIFFLDGGLSSTGNSKVSQQRVIKQLAALRKQLSVEEQKVQTELERNVVSICCD